MSSLNEITFAILDTVRPENMSNGNITTELIQYHIKNVRAQLAKQHVSKNGVLSSAWTQSLGCISLINADRSECCDYPTGCVILRTNIPIPTPIESRTSSITRVGPVNLTENSFQHIEFERVPFAGLNKYTKSLIKWFTINSSNYIYLLVPDNDYLINSLETINVQAAIEDPMLATTFTNCSTGEKCFNSDSRYPVPDSLVPTIIEMVIKKFVALQAQANVDKTNDGSTNPETVINKGI
jgi:hypothetical protein